jgi:hypothetical protein
VPSLPGQIGTVVVQVPLPLATNISPSSLPAEQPSSLLSLLPGLAVVTQTTGYTGTVTSTRTILPLPGGSTATVQIFTPVPQLSTVPAGAAVVTYTIGYDGNVITTKSYLPDPSGPNVVTVVVATPTSIVQASVIPVTVTQTTQWTGTVTSTRTVLPVSGGSTATVQIFTPAAQLSGGATVPGAAVVTYTVGYGGNVPTTQSYLPDTSGSNIVTVLVQTPTGLSYVTQTTDYIGTGISTRTIYPAPGGSTATVQIFTPAIELSPGATVPSAGVVTYTIGYTGNVPTTRTYIPNASGTNVMTVLVETPTGLSYITQTTDYIGTGISTRTIYPAPGLSTGTVQIFIPAQELPAGSAVPGAAIVTYTTGYTGNAPTTRTYIPNVSGTNIMTVLVETPIGLSYITQTTDYIGTGISTRTIYPAPGSSTATVQIFIPALELAFGSTIPGAAVVTLTEGYDGIVPVTRTYVPNSSGTNIMTVIVQTPTQAY